MTPEIACHVDQEHKEQQDAIAEEWRLEGKTDAAFGYLPKLKNEAYLAGYLEGVRSLPCDSSGEILYAVEPEREEFSVPVPCDVDYDCIPF
ncbi:hypothetical protein [Aliterella atlantica]|uniref:Uncharacterized protein n=1 Tax=Aliterella atlantica CENA595 TaxID=1618023 RepID=A0A0D8ZSQ2_9CYAN|nr:hypothetical protein [Aliterella atlantica]KJH70246.1 hypothetical protein UH38_19040 [Aliterella atlantica CENA595]